MTLENQNVCLFFKFGYCKFKSNCKNKHVTQVCDDEKCVQKKCPKRHPRNCKYMTAFGSCKLGTACAYAHGKKNENDKLEQKLDQLIEIAKKKDDDIDKLIKMNNEKDKIIDTLLKKIKEKDDVVKNLVDDMKIIKEKVRLNEDVIKEKESSKVTLVSDDNKQTTSKQKMEREKIPTENKQENRKGEFIVTCLTLVNELEDAIKESKNNIFIREQFKIFNDKIDKEEALAGNIVDFGLKLVLANIKGTDEYTDTGLIKMKMYSFQKSLLQKKLQILKK